MYVCMYVCMYICMYVYTIINIVSLCISFRGSPKTMLFIGNRLVLNGKVKSFCYIKPNIHEKISIFVSAQIDAVSVYVCLKTMCLIMKNETYINRHTSICALTI